MNIYKNVEGVFALIEAMLTEMDSIAIDLERPEQNIKVPGYGKVYELPVGQLAAFIFQSFGLWDRVVQISKSDDPNAALLALAQEDLPVVDVESALTWPVLAAFVVLMANLEVMSLFHVWMNDLVARVGDGDDDALFQAVFVDPSVMQTGAVGSRISTASLNDDRSFFDRLSKALTKTKPSRPKEHLDETRILLEVLDEAGQLKSMTNAELTEWATNLGLYPVDGDALQAIRRLRQKRVKAKNHQKAGSGDSHSTEEIQ